MAYKTSQCFSEKSLSAGTDEDPNGRLFFNGAAMTGLSNVLICGASVDTVRQLFYGVPDPRMLEKLDNHVHLKDEIISLSDYIIQTLPHSLPQSPAMMDKITADPYFNRWHFSRMGKNSGYRFKLQNNGLGVVILFGSFYGKLEYEGQHLKIELSPHFISGHSTQQLWDYLHAGEHSISKLFLTSPEPKGIAVHLACDYQGFDLPKDFLSNFSTASRFVRCFDGINEIDLSDLSESVVTYGSESQAKNYLFGKPTAIQFAAYDKGYEAVKSDKIDYWNHEWGIYTLGEHNPDAVTRRIELRFHHTVIREIGLGMDKSFESFPDLIPYLTDIWRYGMERNRLNQDKHYIHPFWQLLMRDAHFYHPAQNITICRKKKDSVDPISRNIISIIGHSITICARMGMDTKRFMAYLRTLPFYQEIISYYRSRGLTESDLRQNVEKGLSLRRLLGKAA
ncbi:MAG: hypothetical protein Q8N96_00550 [Methylovulum sp.]|nr:hypothetical protein [Methylovulum sp.]